MSELSQIVTRFLDDVTEVVTLIHQAMEKGTDGPTEPQPASSKKWFHHVYIPLNEKALDRTVVRTMSFRHGVTLDFNAQEEAIGMLILHVENVIIDGLPVPLDDFPGGQND
jgi:hypothetical protein